MMQPGSARGWLVVTVLFATAAYALSETFTLETYYPSPRGVYAELRVGGGGPWPTGSGRDAPGYLEVIHYDSSKQNPAFRVDTDNPSTRPVVVDYLGNVGIGTTDPVGKLTVYGAPSDDTGAALTLVSSSTSNKWTMRNENTKLNWEFSATNIPGGSPKLTLQSDGNVGIGTTGPRGALEIAGDAPAYNSIFGYKNDGSGDTYIRGSKATSKVYIGDNNSGDVLIQAPSKVGIGTASPVYPLDLKGGATGGVLRIVAGAQGDVDGDGQMDPAVYIGRGGNVGFHLMIDGLDSANGRGQWAFGAGAMGLGLSITDNDAGNYDPNSGNRMLGLFIQDQTGYVGIGTALGSKPNYPLDVNGTIHATSFLTDMSGSGNAYVCVHAGGDLYRSSSPCS